MDHTEFIETDLFESVFKVKLPATFKDIRSHTFVPDHQEVFTDIEGDANLIFEILEREDQPDQTAIEYFYNDLAEFNEATNVSVHSTNIIPHIKMPLIQEDIPLYGLKGFQDIVPNLKKEGLRERVCILLILMRIVSTKSDVLITLNIPEKYGDSISFDEKVSNHEALMERIGEGMEITNMGKLNGEEEMNE